MDNRYFRSSWEANYARYLKYLQEHREIVGWEYEPHTFFFVAVQMGTRSYTPDFKVYLKNGTHEWHEVKGWMDAKSRVRLARMRKYYPDERLVIVGETFFRAAHRSGLDRIIPYWEQKNKPRTQNNAGTTE